jgi:GAF domain-containing protein/DNA-binding CsgD family transcriptional regulator
MRTKDADEVAGIAVETAVETLDPLVAAAYLYDGDHGGLRPATVVSSGVELDRPPAPGDDGAVWEAFVSGESVDLTDAVGGTDLGDGVAVPLGDHGVLAVGTVAGGLDEADREFVWALATSVEAALDRSARERTVEERTERLRERTDTLDRLRRIDAVARGVAAAVVRATDREGIERAVCERLAEVEGWDLVWIGDRPVDDDGLQVRAAAGDETALEATVDATDPPLSDTPADRATDRGEAVVGDVLAERAPDGWRRTLLDHGHQSLVAAPLTHEGRSYGVLEVYADSPGAFGEEERSLLVELADVAAYAVGAVERERALQSGGGPELDLAVADTVFGRIADRTGVALDVGGVVAESGGYLVYATLDREAADLDAARRLPAVDAVRAVGESDRVEIRLARCPVVEAITESGATVRSVRAGEGVYGDRAESGGGDAATGARVRAVLPATADVRAFVEAVGTRFEVDVLARRTDPGRDVRTGVDALTERQHEVARVAYHSGYFEWPRERTGEEIADALGVSPPTVHKHVRAVQRRLLSAAFGPREGRDDR